MTRIWINPSLRAFTTKNFLKISIPLKKTSYRWAISSSQLSFDGDEIISLLLPAKTVLKVTQTDPGHKGNTATNALKPAILETGLEVQVPLFINEGDFVKIDTKDGSYSERVKE